MDPRVVVLQRRMPPIEAARDLYGNGTVERMMEFDRRVSSESR